MQSWRHLILLRSELRSGNLIIVSVILSLFLILSLLLILNLLGGENSTLGITWWFTTNLRLILPLILVIWLRAFTLFFGSVWVLGWGWFHLSGTLSFSFGHKGFLNG